MKPRRGPVAAVRPPTAAAGWIITLASHRLPAGDVRARYDREFTAELYGMTPGRQLRHSIGVLGASHALRTALQDHAPTMGEIAMTLAHPSKPLGCRLNVHHHWEWRSTEDGSRYMTCARCGKDRSGTSGVQALPTGGSLPGLGGGM